MYFHEVEAAYKDGKKIRRAIWPKGQRVVRVEGSECDLSDEEKKQAGLSADAETVITDTNVLCESDDRAVVGYEFSHEDKNSQDWEVLK